MWNWLIPIGKWFIRLIGGWLPIGTKPVSEWLGKIIWVLGIIALCLVAYNKITTPTIKASYTAKAGGNVYVTNYYYTNSTEAKRSKFIPQLFTEGYVFDEIASGDNRNGFGGKAGLRWDW